jgi:hypothetical protein
MLEAIGAQILTTYSQIVKRILQHGIAAQRPTPPTSRPEKTPVQDFSSDDA